MHSNRHVVSLAISDFAAAAGVARCRQHASPNNSEDTIEKHEAHVPKQLATMEEPHTARLCNILIYLIIICNHNILYCLLLCPFQRLGPSLQTKSIHNHVVTHMVDSSNSARPFLVRSFVAACQPTDPESAIQYSIAFKSFTEQLSPKSVG